MGRGPHKESAQSFVGTLRYRVYGVGPLRQREIVAEDSNGAGVLQCICVHWWAARISVGSVKS